MLRFNNNSPLSSYIDTYNFTCNMSAFIDSIYHRLQIFSYQIQSDLSENKIYLQDTFNSLMETRTVIRQKIHEYRNVTHFFSYSDPTGKRLAILEIQCSMNIIKCGYLSWDTFRVAMIFYEHYEKVLEKCGNTSPITHHEKLHYQIDKKTRQSFWFFCLSHFIKNLIKNDVEAPDINADSLYKYYLSKYRKATFSNEENHFMVNIIAATRLFYGISRSNDIYAFPDDDEYNFPENVDEFNRRYLGDELEKETVSTLKEIVSILTRFIYYRDNIRQADDIEFDVKKYQDLTYNYSNVFFNRFNP